MHILIILISTILFPGGTLASGPGGPSGIDPQTLHPGARARYESALKSGDVAALAEFRRLRALHASWIGAGNAAAREAMNGTRGAKAQQRFYRDFQALSENMHPAVMESLLKLGLRGRAVQSTDPPRPQAAAPPETQAPPVGGAGPSAQEEVASGGARAEEPLDQSFWDSTLDRLLKDVCRITNCRVAT